MPKFGPLSSSKLATCEPRLQHLFNEVIKTFDCTVLEGHRDEAAQNRAFDLGNSKLRWPHGKHNSLPSRAVDVAPYPLNWLDTPRFRFFASEVLATAKALDIKIRWGGDWDGNPATPNHFNDCVHFELVD